MIVVPQRALAITSRHHPIALVAYAGFAILAGLYLTDDYEVHYLAEKTTPAWASVWEYLLLVGAVLALAGALAPVAKGSVRRLMAALTIEGLGAMTLACEVGVYAVVLIHVEGVPLVIMVPNVLLALGFLGRFFTAFRDRSRVRASALHPRPALTLAETPTPNGAP